MNTQDLKHLKDQDLEQSFHRAVSTERKIMHIVLLHVQEVDRRKLFLARGFSSLFEFLVVEMKYSRASAQRRVDGARLITEVPSAIPKLQSGELNLSQVGEIQSAVKNAEKIHQEKVGPKVKAELVERVLKLNTHETQQACAEMLDIPVVKPQRIREQKDESKRIEVTFTKEQFAKFEKVRGLLAHKNFQKKRTQDMADVLETLFDDILAQQIPKPAKAETVTTATDSSSVPESTWNSLTPKRKKIILQKDQCCQFKDAESGRVCGSKFNLHVDHIHPQWDGGTHEPRNLRVLCREHNLFRYKHSGSADLTDLPL